MTTLWSEVRVALRGLLRRPAFAALVVLTLALGIGATTGVFSLLRAALLTSVPFPEPDRLVFGMATYKGRTTGLSAHDYFDYRDQATSFDSLGATLHYGMTIAASGDDQPENLDFVYVSTNLFSTLGVAPARGRAFTEEEGRPAPVAEEGAPLPLPSVAIISNAYWQRHFGGTEAAVGSTLTLRGQPVEVVGVMPPGFRFLVDADLWLPLRLNGQRATARRFRNWAVVGRLAPGVTLADAQAEMNVIAARLEATYPDDDTDMGVRLADLHSALVRTMRPQVLLMMGAVALMLLIACANIANLMLARGIARRSEFAMRVALGASRRRLIRTVVTETVMLALAGGTLGLGVAAALQRLLLAVLRVDSGPLGISELRLDPAVVAFAVAVSLLTGVAVGIIPALRATRVGLSDALKGSTRSSTPRGGARLRLALVASQVALSLVLLLGSALLVRSFANLVAEDLGFDPENLLTVSLALPSQGGEDATERFFREVLEETRAIPGVSAAGMVHRLPVLQGGSSVEVWAPERPDERSFSNQALVRVVLPGYFGAMGMPLVAGRDIDQDDVTGSREVIVISQTMASRLFPDENPVGRTVASDLGAAEPSMLEVVGVVGDAQLNSLGDRPRMAMYLPHAQNAVSAMQLAIRTKADPEGVIHSLRELVWRRNRNVPLENLTAMTAAIRRTTLPQQTLTGTVTTFSLLALLLAAVGLFGVLTYQVNQRQREIGIRMALGARREHVLRAVLGEGLATAGIGAAAGAAAGLAVARLMRSVLYAVAPFDPASLLVATACLLAGAVLACLAPAYRAVRIQPSRALRFE